jgi:hypothetical protein
MPGKTRLLRKTGDRGDGAVLSLDYTPMYKDFICMHGGGRRCHQSDQKPTCSSWRSPWHNDEILELDDSVLMRHTMDANWFDVLRDDEGVQHLPFPATVTYISSPGRSRKEKQAIGLQDDAATQKMEVHHLICSIYGGNAGSLP